MSKTVTNGNVTLESLQARLDKMATWAAQVEQGMRAIRDFQAQASDANLSQEIADMWKRYISPVHEIREHQKSLVAQDVELAGLNDEIDIIESQAFLDVTMEINGDGKAKYTNDASRKAAVTIALSTHEAYHELVDRRRLIQAQIANTKADIAYSEGLIKEFCNRNRALVARIEFDAAVINHLGDK